MGGPRALAIPSVELQTCHRIRSEVGSRDRTTRRCPRGSPIEARLTFDQLYVESNRVVGAKPQAAERSGQLRGSCRWRLPRWSRCWRDGPAWLMWAVGLGSDGCSTTISHSAGSTKPMRSWLASAKSLAGGAAVGVDPNEKPIGAEAEPDRSGAAPASPGPSSLARSHKCSGPR